MKRNREIFGIASAIRLALAAGRSPVCWRRDLTRGASQIRALSRICDWVGRLNGVSAVLRDGPLFGRCMAELVGTPATKDDAGNGAHHAQPRPARTQSPPLIPRKRSQSGSGDSVGRSRSDARNVDASFGQTDSVRGRNSEALPQGRRRLLSQPSGTEAEAEGMDSHASLPASSSNHHRAKAGELPQRASRDLLESCANARQQAHSRRGEQRAADGARLRRRQTTVSAKTRATFAPGLQRSGDFQAEAESVDETFAQRLVRRTVNALRHLQPSANNETQANECLSEQWSTTLDGAAVSSDCLREIIAGGVNATRMKQSSDMNKSPVVAHPRPGARQSRARHETSSPYSPRSLDSEMIPRRERHLSSHSSGTDVDAEAPVITDRDSAARPRANTPTPREFLPASFSNRHPPGGSFDDRFGDEREGGSEAASFSNAERIAPPALASSLPALTPLPEEAQAAVTGVLPLASETARQGARKEADSSEDLDALAAKIKLILDEQARRHGIDV